MSQPEITAAGAAASARRPRRAAGATRLTRRRRRAGLVLSLPALVLVVLLLGVPIAQAVYYSMTIWNGITATWVGPSAYLTTFTDPIFWRVLEN
ncbi:MAG: sugar ABC transporter permease, partial [Actinomycetota bacterium]|nr:sugar ABC transporter permease [Actinomycetota bacterium]